MPLRKWVLQGIPVRATSSPPPPPSPQDSSKPLVRIRIQLTWTWRGVATQVSREYARTHVSMTSHARTRHASYAAHVSFACRAVSAVLDVLLLEGDAPSTSKSKRSALGTTPQARTETLRALALVCKPLRKVVVLAAERAKLARIIRNDYWNQYDSQRDRGGVPAEVLGRNVEELVHIMTSRSAENNFTSQKHAALLFSDLNDDDARPYMRHVAALLDTRSNTDWAIAEIGKRDAWEFASNLASLRNTTYALAATRSLSMLGSKGVPFLKSFLKDDSWHVRSSALDLLGHRRSCEHLGAFVECLEDAEYGVRLLALRIIAESVGGARPEQRDILHALSTKLATILSTTKRQDISYCRACEALANTAKALATLQHSFH